MTMNQQIGMRLRRLREQQNRLQREIAEQSGLPVRTIGRIERGEVDVRLSNLVKIAFALGVTMEELFHDL